MNMATVRQGFRLIRVRHESLTIHVYYYYFFRKLAISRYTLLAGTPAPFVKLGLRSNNFLDITMQ